MYITGLTPSIWKTPKLEALRSRNFTDDKVQLLIKYHDETYPICNFEYCSALTDRSLTYISRLKTITTLNLNACPNFTCSAIEILLSAIGHQLQSLELSGCFATIQSIAKYASKVHTLNLSNCRIRWRKQETPALFLSKLTSLTSINLNCFYENDLSWLHPMASNLTSLSLKDASSHQNIPPLPNLRYLDFSRGGYGTHAPIGAVLATQATSLLSLNISRINATIASLISISKMCPSLQLLNISSNSTYTVANIENLLANHFPSLTSIYLCDSVPEVGRSGPSRPEFINRLRKIRPNLMVDV